jgi:hypothetical protein
MTLGPWLEIKRCLKTKEDGELFKQTIGGERKAKIPKERNGKLRPLAGPGPKIALHAG